MHTRGSSVRSLNSRAFPLLVSLFSRPSSFAPARFPSLFAFSLSAVHSASLRVESAARAYRLLVSRLAPLLLPSVSPPPPRLPSSSPFPRIALRVSRFKLQFARASNAPVGHTLAEESRRIARHFHRSSPLRSATFLPSFFVSRLHGFSSILSRLLHVS